MNKFCTTSGGNTGRGKCDTGLGVIYGPIFAANSFGLTPEQEAELLQSLQTAAFEDNVDERIYPIMGVGNVTFEGEEPTMGTLAATGITRPLRPGTQIYMLEWESGACIDKVLNRFNDWRGGVYFVVNEGTKRLWGYRDAAGLLRPIPCKSVSVYGGGFSDGQNITTTKVRINLGSDTIFKERISSADFNAMDDVDSLVGLQTAILSPISGQLAVTVTDSCGEGDLTEDYAEALAVNNSWEVTGINGAPVTLTGITVNAGVVTFAPEGAVTALRVHLADPSKLATGELQGWASNTVTVVRP